MANNPNQNSDIGRLHQMNPAAANFSAINHGSAGSQLSSQQYGDGLQHQNSGVSGVSDAVDLHKIAAMLQSQQQRIDGLDKLAAALAKTPARKLLCDPQNSIAGTQQLSGIFKGLRSCLQVNESNSDALLRVNQILYDMMQDLPRSPNELAPEVTALIPFFIENLGNSKATVRKSTHKCIGTYVKFSKRLEFVLQNIIRSGLENQNQRTRQHSMLVIPALISLKANVIQSYTTEMRQLIEAVIARLRDPAESVAKTAKKLLLELQKCYPNVFKMNYIDSLANEDERLCCNLILENKFEEATKLIMSTSPSKRMSQNVAGPAAETRNEQPQHNFGAIGKAIVPTASMGSPSMTSPGAYQEQNSTTSVGGSQQNVVSSAASATSSNYKSSQQPSAQSSSSTNVKLGDLSVVGREIINSQVKAKSNAPGGNPRPTHSDTQSNRESSDGPLSQSSKKKIKSQTQNGLPIDPTNGLVFGFLDEELVDALNENNQWKDRTDAMVQIEAELMQLIGSSSAKQKMTEQTATAFLGFIYQFITDINFKISLASIKIVTLLLQEDLINLKLYFNSLLSNLIEKLSDSKQVVRDMVMDCCCNLINRSKPVPFATQVIKYLQHANWHVREGVLILLVRCILVAAQSEAKKGTALKPNMTGETSALGQLCTNAQLIEEVCFLVKVEDKKQLQQMGIDTLALMIAKSNFKNRTDSLVMKELGVASESQKSQFGHATTKDNQIYAQIQQRMQAQAFPLINSSNAVEFAPATTAVAPSAQFMAHKQNTGGEQALSEGAAQPEFQQISQSLQQMQINTNFTKASAANNGPSSKMQANQASLMNQISPSNNAYKTPSMAFLESKRREEEKQLQNQQQNYPQSADFKKIAGPLSPISAPNSNHTPANQSALQQNQQSSYSMRKLQKEGRKAPASVSSDQPEEKIAMWLPSFSPMPEAASSQQPSTVPRKQDLLQSPIMMSGKDPRMHSMQLSQDFNNQQHASPPVIPLSTKAPGGSYHLNATASSSATFIEERRNMAGGPNQNRQGPNSRQPMYAEANKTQSDMQGAQNNMQQQYQQRSGYIPEAHTNKPRSIQSNYDKQRAFNQSQGSNNSSNQSSTGPSQQTIAGTTQPTNNSNGFDKSQISDRLQLLKNTNKYKTKVGESGQQQITGGHVQPDHAMMMQQNQDQNSEMQTQQTMNYSVLPESEQQSTSHHQSMYNKRHGPIRAAHHTINQEPKSSQNVGNKKMSAGHPTHVQLKQRQQTTSSQSSQKPPTISQYSNFTGIGEARGANQTQYDDQSRASSIDYNAANGGNPADRPIRPAANSSQMPQRDDAWSTNNTKPNDRPIRPAANSSQMPQRANTNQRMGVVSQTEKKPGNSSKLEPPQSLQNLIKQDSAQAYELKEEPLTNPEAQLRPAIEALKSSDWSKTFEACSVIKRGIMFHKNLFTHPSSMTAQIFKDIVKAGDSLRSQVAKNACITLQAMFQELTPRDVDSHIESVMPMLIKRSTDTNTFISQEAEKTLIAVCNNCTETRVFAALQAQAMKSAAYKEKVALCYTVMIERLAHKLKNFRDLERLVQSVVRFLSEGAVEVRNQAKYAILTLQSVSGSQRELDGILLKARLNENQMEKVRKVLASEDFESLSNYANTRYGASMRASPLGGARHTQYNAQGAAQPRHVANGSYGASGSDGFQRNNLSNMQQTFLSSGAVPNNQAARGGSSGPVGTSGIGNAGPRGGVMSDHHITMQRGAASNQGSSSGFDGTQNTFNKRTTSVSKPVDRNLIEEMRNLVDSCNEKDWQKRVKAIDSLQQFSMTKSTTIKNSHASFINVMDAYCKLLQDNNTKVQAKAQQSFEVLVSMQEMGPLITSSLSMIVQALTQNLCSTNANVRNLGDKLFDSVEVMVQSESRGNTNALLQPIVGCLGQGSNKNAKPHLVDRLSNLVEHVDKQAIITRLLNPLVQPGHKIQNEANGNVALKQALQRLASTIQSAELGLMGMGIGLNSHY